jgi:hypothetical protein
MLRAAEGRSLSECRHVQRYHLGSDHRGSRGRLLSVCNTALGPISPLATLGTQMVLNLHETNVAALTEARTGEPGRLVYGKLHNQGG